MKSKSCPHFSSKQPNLMSLLHIMSGLGVSPFFTVSIVYCTTLAQYSSCSETTSSGQS